MDEIYEIKQRLNNVEAIVAELNVRISEIEEHDKWRRRSRIEQNEIRKVVEQYLDFLESMGNADFVGKSTGEVIGGLVMWQTLNGEQPIEVTRGNKTIVTKTVCGRYNLVTRGSYFYAM